MSTISNERLEKLSEYDCADRYEVMSMATELLALRKEREAAVPVAYISKADLDAGYPHILARKDYSKACPMAVFAAPPAQPVAVPNEGVESLNLLLRRSYFRRWLKDPRGYVGGSIPVSDLVNVVLFADACRAAMLAAPGKPVAENDTTSQQCVALVGKAVVPEGWKLVPVEPTKEMVAKMRYHNGGYDKHIKNGYAAMLAVAPEPCK
ncbi:hypothetical protein ACMSYX_003729 [Cronobacter dublinensis]